ncbi:hypothetical protein BT63DRAFT_454931 [Microthyrium microscopicum]|uniref:Aminoglycoside phosphotransferase domain-containing protein n=1 Tax=Microthyrium microscopicum TaxID=703497 RepID=A0A6A6U9U1_9PEZI|nr:hypothetical protein BT63DRAFT_454931 [Microthyrium microscopicum]
MANTFLHPNDTLLNHLFPAAKPKILQITKSERTICVFRVFFDAEPFPGAPKALIVHLESSDDRTKPALFKDVGISRVAALAIPDYIVPTLAFGSYKLGDRPVAFAVKKFLPRVVPLSNVWSELAISQQEDIMNSLHDIVKKFHFMDLKTKEVQEVLFCLDRARFARDQRTPYFQPYLLEWIKTHVDRNPLLTFEERDGKIRICSSVPELKSIVMERAGLQLLEAYTYLSHGNLEPKNILVRPVCRKYAPAGYEIIAIVNWQNASLMPSAIEWASKDNLFGYKGSDAEWYTLYKTKLRDLVPKEEEHYQLVMTWRLIHDAWCMLASDKVENEFRRRWLIREGFELSDDPLDGWKRVNKPEPPVKIDPRREPENTRHRLLVELENERVAREPRTVMGRDDEKLEKEVRRDMGLLD